MVVNYWETKKRHLSTKGGKILRCLFQFVFMVNTYDNIFVAEWLTFHISRCRNSTTNTPRYWILASRTQMDLNHHQFVLPLNYVCIQWVEILPQPNRRKKLCVFSWWFTQVNTMYASRMTIP